MHATICNYGSGDCSDDGSMIWYGMMICYGTMAYEYNIVQLRSRIRGTSVNGQGVFHGINEGPRLED